METTTNFAFKKPTVADKAVDWFDAENYNWDAVDALPIPTQSGSNTHMSYQKFADGTLHVWGCVDHGTSYPCTNQVATATGFTSTAFTLNFPVAFAATTYALVASVSASAYPDTSVAISVKGTGSVTAYYACPLNDADAANSKTVSVDMWGRWK